MKIEDVDPSRLVPYKANNQSRDPAQMSRVVEFLKHFGFNQPVVVDEDNVILVGHSRTEAAKELKMPTVPTLKLTGLTDLEKRAYRILDNVLQSDASWNVENMGSELDYLDRQGFDLESWGLDKFARKLG